MEIPSYAGFWADCCAQGQIQQSSSLSSGHHVMDILYLLQIQVLGKTDSTVSSAQNNVEYSQLDMPHFALFCAESSESVVPRGIQQLTWIRPAKDH